MILKQFYLGCLAHASYLVGDEGSHAAAVVDPMRDVDQYLQFAREHGVEIRHVFLTHFHADFVAGHLELRDRVGATIYLGARADAEYAFRPMKDGDCVEFGSVRLSVVETPGHSPESISILVFDLAKDSEHAHAVLTGDTLFIGDVGRPDLRASLGWSADELGRLLYDSLRDKLLKLPDETVVYPGHGAGSMCGKQMSQETVSTIGVERQYNYALQPMTRDAFVGLVTADQPEPPQYFSYDAVLNKKEHPTLDETLASTLKPLSLEVVLALMEVGAQALDVREPADFAGAHLAGSINIPLGGQYASWAGTVLTHDCPIVLIAEPGREEEAAVRLGRIGYDQVTGFLRGGMQTLDGHPSLIERTDRITAVTLAEQLASDLPPVVLDVRTVKEWQTKRIEGSLNVPLNRLLERLAEVPRGRSLVVHCASGYRSSIAASLLARDKRDAVDLVGGISAWEAARLPLLIG